MRHNSTRNIGKQSRGLLYCAALLLLTGLLLTVPHRGTALVGEVQDESLIMSLGYAENFDGVTAPALPANWTSVGSGPVPAFVTSTTSPDTAPNTAFVPDPNTAGQAEIVSPAINISPTGSTMTFRNFYLTEANFDGGVLEISIDNGPFVDIITAGGSFISGGYNSNASGTGNPLPIPPATSRPAWTGNSGGFITTSLNLPPAAAGHVIRLKWRMGTDSSVGGTGWRVDTINIANIITGENTNNIAIPDSGAASLYPSSVNISNLIGSISNVAIVLNDFSHTAPDDVDLMLVSPSGRKVILMSDVGGAIPVTNLSLVIQDATANSLPDEGPLVSGTFKPTNVGADDTFPAPAPAGPPTGNTLAAFNGANPNGTWNLYLVDDNGNNAGSISGGWSMLINTNATACGLSLSSSLQVFPITGGAGSFDVTTPFGCDWTATSLSSFVSITSGASGSGGVTPITFTVEPNTAAGRTGTISVTNGGFTRNFSVQQPSGCPFSLSQETLNFSSAGGPGNVSVTAAGICGWTATTKDNWITINSGAGSGNGTATFTIANNPSTTERTGTIIIGARTLTIVQAAGSGNSTLFDFDGDAKADLSVFRTTNDTWYINNSSNGSLSSRQFGLTGDKLVVADYDGDARADYAVFRRGTWYILSSLNGSLRTTQWGVEADWVTPGDYDGDGKADIAVWRESSGTWYIQRSSDGINQSSNFGRIGDYPVARDYDGDGTTDIAVFRPSQSRWYIRQSSDNTVQSYVFGFVGDDKLVPADYDGDGKTDLAVWRVNTATWYLLQSTAGFAALQFGLNTDQLAPADYDGDGKADITVMRQGVWYIMQSTTGTVRAVQWGGISDVAVPFALIAT